MSAWHSSLLSCDGPCFYAYCCPGCALSKARKQYDGGSSSCMTPAFIRSVIREGYGIEGSCAGDLLSPYCCPCCTARQLLYETQMRGSKTMKLPTDEWHVGLFQFKDSGHCLMACCCPLCLVAQTRTRYDRSNFCFNLLCIPDPCPVRGILRGGYSIKGGKFGDLFAVHFCLCCAAHQMACEVDYQLGIQSQGQYVNQVAPIPQPQMGVTAPTAP
eukprot:NODE_5564_length_932_cov_102.831891_g5341_i0.p1 GENE.NODE_5564_length_932_cov_102.831891_g5341_i0~~NODE_5564_length_932_cov_102.831891_g5341_i0.p1  ORF type:complete len:233 (-),score=44.44 NODE_5564_length_932_cov_102.831891_g5341_i0:232-876(-)